MFQGRIWRRRHARVLAGCSLVGLFFWVCLYLFGDWKDTHPMGKSWRQGLDAWYPGRQGPQNFDRETYALKSELIQQRHTALKHACARHEQDYRGRYPNESFAKHMLYHAGSNLVFCGVEKTGYTFWRRVFMTLAKPRLFSSPYNISAYEAYLHVPSLADFPDTMAAILNSAHTAIFTRNPYERLYSAYVDKLVGANYPYMLTFGNRIIRDYRPGAGEEETFCGKNATFPEFVKFYIEYERGNEEKDNHFMTLTEHCRPCDVKYEFIGKMEDFLNEFSFFTHYFDLRHLPSDTIKLKKAYKMDAVNNLLLDFRSVNKAYKGHTCFSPSFAWRRQWKFMQIRGFISNKFPVPEVSDYQNSRRQMELLISFMEKSLREDTALGKQKKLYMAQAYKMVSQEDKEILQKLFQPDCEIFGYKCKPP